MVLIPQVDGRALIRTGSGTDGALEDLGTTRNGVEQYNEPFMLDVPGDENGGDDGPPIEIQYLGELVRMRCELTKFDENVAAKIRKRINENALAAGVPPTPGSLLFANDFTFRVLIVPEGTYGVLYAELKPTNRPVNLPKCVPREPIEENKGTKYSTLLLEFTAYKTGADDTPANTLWNTTTD